MLAETKPAEINEAALNRENVNIQTLKIIRTTEHHLNFLRTPKDQRGSKPAAKSASALGWTQWAVIFCKHDHSRNVELHFWGS